jgi:3-oxoacyl-[acyl-carrier-protein] synthase II
MPPFAAAITGIGLVTPAGIGVDDNWSGVIDGKAAAAHVPELSGLPVSIACRVPGFSPDDLSLRNSWQWDRYAQFAVVAAREALQRAGLGATDWADDSRVAVVVGSGAGGTASMEAQHRLLIEAGPADISPLTLPMGLLNMAAGQLAIEIGARGPCLAPCTACASGGTAIGIARDMLRLGTADIVIAGGAEAPVTQFYVSAFARMRALSRHQDPATASRPFDVARDGFVIGEGAAILVLEREDHAAARGARTIARVIGYGASADAHHVTSPHPQGRGAALAIHAALADAGLTGSDVGYVNAHGTSTQLNDSVEAAVIREVIGAGTPVSSTKGVTGHLLGAGAAVELAYAALAAERDVIPPTAGLADPDPAMEIDLVYKAARPGPVDIALSNSFGFGGQNTALLVAA